MITVLGSVALALVVLYWVVLRRWFGHWGATGADLTRAMAGDAAVADPTYSTTLAITIDARPEYVWPWLIQLGYRRGGLYSYDWLDRLFGYLDRPSAVSILPQFQQLAVGDQIPMGRGGGFPVTAIEPYRALVLSGTGDGFAWAWQFGLFPLDKTQTRLVSRNRVRVPSTIGSWLFMRVIEPAAFLMTRRMLLGLKRRAETLSAAPGRPFFTRCVTRNSMPGVTDVSHAHPLKISGLGWIDARRALLACGVLSSLLYVIGIDVIAALRHPDYHGYTSQMVSELMAVGAPTRTLLVWLFVPYNLLVFAFATGVLASADGRRATRLAAAALAAYGVLSTAGLLLTPMGLRGTVDSSRDTLHIAATFVMSISIVASIAFGAFVHGRRFRLYSFATIATVVAFGALAGYLAGPMPGPTPWLGLAERVNIYATMVWILVFAVSLLRGGAWSPGINDKHSRLPS